MRSPSTPPRLHASTPPRLHASTPVLILTSVILALLLAPAVAGEAQATTLIPSTDFIPDGFGEGDKFRLLFITSERTNLVPIKTSFTFFNDFVQNAVRENGLASLKPYAHEFRAVVSCGNASAISNTDTWTDRGDWQIPIYWLGGAKISNDYREFWGSSYWRSNQAVNESGQSMPAVYRDGDFLRAWTGSTNRGHPAGILAGGDSYYTGTGTTVCSNLVTFGSPRLTGHSINHFTMASTSKNSMYGLSPVFQVSYIPGPPAAPTVVSTTHNTASITWEAPEFHGATPIFDYNVQIKEGDGSWVGSTPYHWGIHTNLTLTGLSPDTEYHVRVHAKNHRDGGSETGYGLNSPVTTFRTQDLTPSAPDKPVVSPGVFDAHVSWSPPSWVGAPPLRDYDLRVNPAISAPVFGTSTSFTLTNLSPDTEYAVSVRANNAAGLGQWSPVTTFHTKTIVPSAPSKPTVTEITDTSATVSWSAPTWHGATPIFDYNVQIKHAGGSWVGSTPYHYGTHTSLTLTGLSPDTEYQVRVYAKNHRDGGSETGYGPNSPVTTFHTN